MSIRDTLAMVMGNAMSNDPKVAVLATQETDRLVEAADTRNQPQS